MKKNKYTKYNRTNTKRNFKYYLRNRNMSSENQEIILDPYHSSMSVGDAATRVRTRSARCRQKVFSCFLSNRCDVTEEQEWRGMELMGGS